MAIGAILEVLRIRGIAYEPLRSAARDEHYRTLDRNGDRSSGRSITAAESRPAGMDAGLGAVSLHDLHRGPQARAVRRLDDPRGSGTANLSDWPARSDPAQGG